MKKLSVLLLTGIFLASCGKEPPKVATTAAPVSVGTNNKIGVILPMTGKLSQYGKSTLQGIECAAGIFKPCESEIKVELIIKDDAGDPAIGAAAVEELANEKVNVIIGTLASSSIDAVAQKAQALDIPLLSLSQKDNIVSTGDNIFSVALSASSQVKAIVSYAVKEKKLKNFAILYPMNAYGETFKDLFSTEVAEAKGKVIAAKGYNQNSYDFGGLLSGLEGKIDAIFIPDSYRVAGYIASLVSGEEYKDVLLLGINRWNNPQLLELTGDTLEGSVFVDGFFEKSTDYTAKKFIDNFNAAYGISPTILEAQSFDAAKLAIKAVAATGGNHSKDIRDSLAAMAEVEGSTGLLGFDPNREASRRIFLLSVKDGKISELSSTPQAKKEPTKY